MGQKSRQANLSSIWKSECCSTQPGTGTVFLTSQKSKHQCHSCSPKEETFGLNGWDLTSVIRLFVDVFPFLELTGKCVDKGSKW